MNEEVKPIELVDEKNIGDEPNLHKELEEAKKVVKNYVDNPSDISGSLVNIHENSPFLDENEKGEPAFSGSRWKRVIKNKKA